MAKDYKKTVFGERLAKYRKEAGFSTVEALSDAIADMDISKGTLTNIEAGRRKDITVQELLSISRALGVSPISLICDVQQPCMRYQGDAYSDRSDITNKEIIKLFDLTSVEEDNGAWFEATTGHIPSDSAKYDSEIWSELQLLESYREQEGVHRVLAHKLLEDGKVKESQEQSKLAQNIARSVHMVLDRLSQMGINMSGGDPDSYRAMHTSELGLAAKRGDTDTEQDEYEAEP